MEQFVNRETNNKRVMQVLDEEGNIVETMVVRMVRDDAVEVPTTVGTPLNATTFNEMLGEINDTVTYNNNNVKLNLSCTNNVLTITTENR